VAENYIATFLALYDNLYILYNGRNTVKNKNKNRGKRKTKKI